MLIKFANGVIKSSMIIFIIIVCNSLSAYTLIPNVVATYDNNNPKVIEYSRKQNGKLRLNRLEQYYYDGQIHIEENYINQISEKKMESF